MEKSEEQIAKDKEAVARMIGAKSAMEAAINRVEQLERTMAAVRQRLEYVSKAFSGEIYISVYDARASRYEARPIKDVFGELDRQMRAVL